MCGVSYCLDSYFFILSRFIFYFFILSRFISICPPKKKSSPPKITPFLFFKIMASPNPKSPSYIFVKSEASMSWDSMNRDNMKKYESRQYESTHNLYYYYVYYKMPQYDIFILYYILHYVTHGITHSRATKKCSWTSSGAVVSIGVSGHGWYGRGRDECV